MFSRLKSVPNPSTNLASCCCLLTLITILFCFCPRQDPKTSRWLWNIRERDRQKRRTENYRKIMSMARDKNLKPTEDGETGQQIVALEKMTRLEDPKQMANFLTYGKWGLKDADIVRLNKEEERKERVRGLMRWLS